MPSCVLTYEKGSCEKAFLSTNQRLTNASKSSENVSSQNKMRWKANFFMSRSKASVDQMKRYKNSLFWNSSIKSRLEELMIVCNVHAIEIFDNCIIFKVSENFKKIFRTISPKIWLIILVFDYSFWICEVNFMVKENELIEQVKNRPLLELESGRKFSSNDTHQQYLPKIKIETNWNDCS